MSEKKHIIWSNIDLDLDDWYDDLHEEYPALGEEGLRDMMYQYNFEYFSDTQSQLDMYVGSPILVLANLGLWDGRHRGFGEIKSGNIKDCMETDYEYAEWYVDENGEFASRQIHHDGTNYYRYRRYKNVSHGKKLWYTYICPGHADDPARCPFVSIREDELNEVLFTAIQSQIQLAADLEEVVKRLNAQPEFRRQRADATAKLEAAKRTLKRSQSLYDSLYQNYVEQLMTEQEYVTLKARYKAEAEEAERLIAALEQEQRESKVYTSENRFLSEFRSFMGTDTLTKEMASALVERIYVDADKNIDIRLRYRDEYMALLKFIEGRAAV